MSYNKKALLSIVKKLDKAKAPGKPKDVKIINQQGQRKYPGQVTEIQGDTMATDGYGYIPLMVVPNNGEGPQMVMPNTGERKFNGATSFIEYPVNDQDFYEDDLDEEQIAELRAGGYIVEDISVPSLTQAQKGISISDPKEYAYRKGMYDDSLSLFNAYQFQKKNINPIPKNKIFVDDYNKTSKAYPDIRRPGEPLVITVNDMTKKRNKNFNKNLPKFSHAEYLDTKKNPSGGFDPMHKPSGDYTIYDYNKKLKFNYPVALGKHSSPDIWHSKIKPSGSYFDGVAYSPIYKKPVQAIYKPGEKSIDPYAHSKTKVTPKVIGVPPDQNEDPTKKYVGANEEMGYDENGNPISSIEHVYETNKLTRGLKSEPNKSEIVPLTSRKSNEPSKSDFAYRDQAVYEYDEDTKKFNKDSSRKAPLPYAERYSKGWESNTSKDIPESGPRVWIINGKEYYNQEDANAAANQYEELPSYNFQVGGQKKGEVLDIPEMQAYADPNKRKQQNKLIDKARAIASTIEGRQALKQGNYKDFSIENMKKFIKSATDYKKEAEDYHKARRLVSENKMDSDSFARRYNEKGWAKFDEDVANENYKGEYQQAVDKANKRKGKNMAYTDAVLEFTGAPALQRIAADPIGTAKGVGQTIGDIATLPYGVAEGAYNYATDGNFDMGKNAFGQKYGEGLNETLDVLAVVPAFAGVSKITDLATPALIKGVNKLGKYATTQTPLAKAYKLNPYAERLNDVNKSYRVAGLDALEDFQNTGVLRSSTPTISEGANLFQRAEHRPTAFPSFQKGYADMSYAPEEGAVVFETKLPTFKRGDINPVTGEKIKGRHYAHRVIDPKTGRTMTEIPGSEIKIFGDKPHWLKGYPEVPKELPSSPNNSELVDLWRIQEKGSRPMSELAAEGKLGKNFQNEKAIQHFKDREEHFGQWFTKDKSDFDFYKADREFINPEVIKLQVPKSKLESFTDYNKSLSRAPDREFVVPSEEQNLYKVTDTPNELPSSPTVYPTDSLAMPTATAPLQTTKPAWKLEELPGLHLKSTMGKGAVSISKDGTIEVKQMLDAIGKESGGADKVKLIREALGDNVPQKMDYNQFRKTVQEQLIPLEKTLVDDFSDYGLERIGYTSDNLVTKEVDGKIIHEFAPDYIENQTLILSNKGKFGRGSSEHGNPDETLGHIHFLRNVETPDVLTVTQIQSDAFQGTYRIMPKNATNAAPLEKQQKSLQRMEELQNKNKSVLNKMKTEGIDEAGMPVQDYQIKQFEDIVKAQEQFNLFKKAEIENFTQKQLLDKNHQERYIQELVDYASKRGDVNKVRLPTSDTAAKIQGYDTQKTWNITNLENGDDVVLNDGTVGKVTSDTFINSITVTTQDGKKLSIDMSDAGYGSSKNSPVESVNNVNVKEVSMFSPKHTTILKKYSEQPKLIKKLYGVDVKIVKDGKGNSWYEFNIPDKFKEGTGEIKAFKYGGNVNKLKKFIN